jgi:hypothetical protein
MAANVLKYTNIVKLNVSPVLSSKLFGMAKFIHRKKWSLPGIISE